MPVNYRPAVAAILICFLQQLAYGNHFYGGTLSWSPDPHNRNTVNFRLSLMWERNQMPNICNSTLISARQAVTGDSKGRLQCLRGCPSSNPSLLTLTMPLGTLIGPEIANTDIFCTETSVDLNWMRGEAQYQYNFPLPGRFIVGYQGTEWTALVNMKVPGWSISAMVDLSVRKGSFQLNNPPQVLAMGPMQVNNKCSTPVTIRPIQVVDLDNDSLRCRWGSNLEECANTCGPPSFLTLDPVNCTLTFTPNTVPIGRYAVSIIIEDFPPPLNSMTPLSSASAHFLLDVQAGTVAACTPAAKPTFVNPTPNEGETYHYDTRCRNASPIWFYVNVYWKFSKQVNDISMYGPEGVTRTPADVYLKPALYVTLVNVSWTPRPTDAGLHSICFVAHDLDRTPTEPRCVLVYVYDNFNIIPSSLCNSTSCCPVRPTMLPSTSPSQADDGLGWRLYLVIGLVVLVFTSAAVALAVYLIKRRSMNKRVAATGQ